MKQLGEWFKLVGNNGNFFTSLSLWTILLLPLILYANIAYPFAFGRLLIFMFALTIFIAGCVISGPFKFTAAWWRSPILWWMISWLLIVTATSAIFGVQWQRSFWGIPSRSTGLLFMYGLIVLIVLLLALVRTKKDWLRIFSVLSWVGTISAIYAILQRFGVTLIYKIASGERMGGLIGNPIFLGMFLLLTIFITAYFAINTKGILRQLFIANVVFQLLAIFLTISRGPLIGLLIGIVVFVIGWLGLNRVNQSSSKYSWRLLWWTVLPLGALITLSWYYKLPFSRIFELSVSSATVKSRLFAWHVLWNASHAKPIFGWGIENVQAAFNTFYQTGLAALGAGETIFDRAHNLFMDQLITTGWVGVLFGLVFIILLSKALLVWLKSARRSNNYSESILIIALISTGIAYFVSLMTAFDVTETLLYGSIIIAGIIFFTSKPIEPLTCKWFVVVPLPLFAIMLLLTIKVFIPAFTAGRYVFIGNKATDVGNYPIAHQAYNAAQYHPNPYSNMLLNKFPTFARQYSLELLNSGKVSAAKEIAIDGLGIATRIKSINLGNPLLMIDDPLLNVILAQINPERLDVAKQHFNQLIAENPNREYLYMMWARVLIGIKEYPDAKVMLDKASQLSSVPRELEFWRAYLGIASKQLDSQSIVKDLDTAVSHGIEFKYGDQDVLKEVVAYLVKFKDFSSAAYYEEFVVRILPQDITERINFATIYRQLGDFDKAEVQAREVVKIDPTKLEETKKFLAEMGRAW